ncbi:MAG: hypothetical protein WD208_10385 [Dehalococcoidia bacterium]
MPELQPLKPMMLVRPPNSIFYEESFWDELADAGINEVALQWLCLLDDRGGEQTRYPQVEDTHPRGLAAVGGSPVQRTPVAAYSPNPELYRDLDWQPPEMPSHMAGDAQDLKDALDMAVSKGFKLYTTDDKGYFLRGGFGTGKLDQKAPSFSFCNPEAPGMTVARARDTLANYPQFSGLLLDGPDYKWEIQPGHRDDMWVEKLDDEDSRRFAEANGFSMQRILDGRERFKERLHSLSPAAVEDFIANQGGTFGSLEWWLEEPDTVEWFQFKAAVIEWNVSTAYAGVKKHLPQLEVANSSRPPAIAAITGHNLRRKRAYTDFQMPKEYWWSGGVAGFRGTVVNWVRTLREWNPGLSEEDASRWFSAAFDYPMPSDYPVADYDKEATDEWFSTSVRDQTRKMLAAAGSPEKFVPWVGLEHFGSNWVTPSELRRMLAEMQSLGATRYCYFVYNSMKPEIWSVINEFSRG